ncbi:LOW QUALITY PROTEIN: glutamyl aminopeptidase-like [Centruroides vittatus]|uniref:LOW QUALITY PROTEIN: glutamyl aminopeptidase-like n=1 Tax=Centruroides vittatus TaxID=120091 RepID=UPI00350E8FE7
MSSDFSPLQTNNDKIIQYNTMEINEDQKHEQLNQKTYSCTQLISIVGIIFLLHLSAFLLAIFLVPHFRCDKNKEIIIIEEETFPWLNANLPDFIYPIHYSLHLHPNQNEFLMTGDVNITFRVELRSDFIVLNSKELSFSSVEMLNKAPKFESYIENNQLEFVYIKFEGELKPDVKYTLRIQFEKKLTEVASGVYVTSYTDTLQIKRYVVLTYFNNKQARKGFPCFDDPRFKATFQLGLSHSFDYDPLSITDLKETISNDNIVKSIFEKTVPISTTSLGFIISDFKFQRKDLNGISIRISTPSQYYSRCNFALQTSYEILQCFKDKLNFTYPFSKLDISAIPNFGYPGSNSLSLIFMKLSNILMELQEGYEGKEVVVSSLAHQIAHQYFGNEVTMNNWDNQWLIEGLACYLEHLVAENVLKEKIEFYVDFLHPTYRVGKFINAEPLREEVRKQSEIINIFSELSYYKGASILWMLDNFVGRDALLSNLSHLLEMYRSKSISHRNIWDIIDENNLNKALNISAMMNSWIEQKGYPIITVIRHRDRLVVSQKPFLLESKEKNHVLWNIPFSLQTDKTPIQWHILKDSESSINIPINVSWFKVNVNQTGLYRVNYDEPTWKTLTSLLENNHQVFSAVDRAGLIDDIFMLSRAGILHASYIFDVVKYLKNEKEYAPWKIALSHFHDLLMLLEDDSHLLLIQNYFSTILASIITEFSDWNEEESNQMIKLRTSVFLSALEIENVDIIQKSIQMFRDWMNRDEPIQVNLEGIVYLSGIKYGSRKEWQFCWDKYKNSDKPREKELLLNALGYSRDVWQLKQYLDFTLNENEISIENIALVISSIASNPSGRLIVWDFIQEYWDFINKIFSKENYFINVILTKVTLYFRTEFKYNQVKNFFERVQLNTEVSKQILENIQWNIKWDRSIKERFIELVSKNVN